MTAEVVLMCKWQPTVVATILDQGCSLHLVLDDYDWTVDRPDPALLARCARVYRVSSFDSHEQLAGIAADLVANDVRPDLLFAHTEFCQLGAGYLDLLVRGGRRPATHAALRDKRLMKTAVAAAGVPTARWRSLPDPADLAAVAGIEADLTFPVVVKPAYGVGSMSTRTVATRQEFRDVAAGYRFEELLRSRQLIVEERVVGRELHVDALWLAGEPRFFLVSAYHENRLRLIEHGAALDGSYIVSQRDHPDLYERVARVHRQVNGALEITDAVTHVEFFETGEGDLVFSEAAARLGGGWIPDVLTEYLGEDVWEAVARALVTGECPKWTPPRTYLGGLNLRPDRAGRIVGMPDPAAVRLTPGVRRYAGLLSVGDTIAQRFAAEWVANVILEAETEPDYLALAEKVAEVHRVVVE